MRPFSTRQLGQIRPLMEDYVSTDRLAGIVTLVATKDELLHLEAVGQRDVARGRPMMPDTIFRIFSMTKPVVSVAVLTLCEQGLLKLSDPICNYLPELNEVQVYLDGEGESIRSEPLKQPITVQHLLTHTSGFIYDFSPPHPVQQQYLERGVMPGGERLTPPGIVAQEGSAPQQDLPSMISALATIPLLHQPEERWSYGVSTDILGRLIEVVTNKPLASYLHQQVFDPLGMVDTGFSVVASKRDRLAALYIPAEEVGLDLRDDPEQSQYAKPANLASGGAGLVSTASDYLLFCQMLLHGGTLNGHQILSPASVKMMRTNHLKDTKTFATEYSAAVNRSATDGIGFGLGVAVVFDPKAAGEVGGAGEFSWGGAASTDFWIDPENGVVGIVMTQLIPAATYYPLRYEMKELVYPAAAS